MVFTFSLAQVAIPSLLLRSPLNCLGTTDITIVTKHGPSERSSKSNNKKNHDSLDHDDLREKDTENDKGHEQEYPEVRLCSDDSEEEEEEISKGDTQTEPPSYYSSSVSDDSSQTSSAYRYFYDGATSVSTDVSLPSNFQAKQPKKRSNSSQRRLDELYQQGKERKRSELKRFLEKKINQNSQDSTLLRSSSNRRCTQRIRSCERVTDFSMKDNFDEESINGPGNCYTKMNELLKRHQDITLKQRREIARARAKVTQKWALRQEEQYVRHTSRTRSYGASTYEGKSTSSNARSRSMQRKTPIHVVSGKLRTSRSQTPRS